MIKAIVFDFGQTLVDSAAGFRAAEKYVQGLIFSDLKMASWDGFLSQYRKIRKSFHQRSQFSREEIWAAVYTNFGQKSDTNRLKLWESEYWKRVQVETKPFPETMSVLDTLTRHYELAVVTNTQGQKTTGTHRISLFPEIESYFKVIIVAGEGPVPPKPDPTPFRQCMERLKIDCANALYVGDDWRIDIFGAENAGIQPIWLQHHSVRRNWPDVNASVPVIKTLEELLDLPRLLS